MTTCKNCGGEIADTAKFCLKCGTKVVRHPFCPNCGTELKPNTKFCPSCGTALDNKVKSEEKAECVKHLAETPMKSNTGALMEQEHISKESSADRTFSGEAESLSAELVSAEYLEEKTRCPSCKAELPAKYKKFCPACGVNIDEARKTLESARCLQCGTELSPNAKFCPSCGTRKEAGFTPIKSAYLSNIASTYTAETGGDNTDLSIMIWLGVFFLGLIIILIGAGMTM